MADEITFEKNEAGGYTSSDGRAVIVKIADKQWDLAVDEAKFKKDFKTKGDAEKWYADAPAPIGPNPVDSNLTDVTRQRFGRIAVALREIDADVFAETITFLESIATKSDDLVQDEVTAYREAVSTDRSNIKDGESDLVKNAFKVAERVAERMENVLAASDPEDRINSRLYGDAFRLEKLLGQHPPRTDSPGSTSTQGGPEKSVESEVIAEKVEADDADADDADIEDEDLAEVFND